MKPFQLQVTFTKDDATQLVRTFSFATEEDALECRRALAWVESMGGPVLSAEIV